MHGWLCDKHTSALAAAKSPAASLFSRRSFSTVNSSDAVFALHEGLLQLNLFEAYRVAPGIHIRMKMIIATLTSIEYSSAS